MTIAPTRVLAIDGSPDGAGRTARVLEAVLAGARARGAETRLVSLARGVDAELEDALAAVHAADAFVLGSPIYRASHGYRLKELLERVPRGMWGEATAPLTGRAVGLVATGASHHHFLGLADLRQTLQAFFAAYVVPPGLYVAGDGFDADKQLLPATAATAGALGEAVVALAQALGADPALHGVVPQA